MADETKIEKALDDERKKKAYKDKHNNKKLKDVIAEPLPSKKRDELLEVQARTEMIVNGTLR